MHENQFMSSFADDFTTHNLHRIGTKLGLTKTFYMGVVFISLQSCVIFVVTFRFRAPLIEGLIKKYELCLKNH